MARTTPVSKGWTTLLRPPDTTLPWAEATMSIVPQAAQASAAQNNRMMVVPMARPIGEGGVSTISKAAGRKAVSSARRPFVCRNGTTICGCLAGRAVLADFIDPSLQPMQCSVAATRLDQRVMSAILDQAATFEGEDAVYHPNGGEAVGDDQ